MTSLTNDHTWDVLNKEMVSLYGAGDYDGAIIVGEKALQIAKNDGDPERWNEAITLENLGASYRAKNALSVAEQYLEPVP